MSNRRRSSDAGIFGFAFGVVFLLIASVFGVIGLIIRKIVNTPRMPKALEPELKNTPWIIENKKKVATGLMVFGGLGAVGGFIIFIIIIAGGGADIETGLIPMGIGILLGIIGYGGIMSGGGNKDESQLAPPIESTFTKIPYRYIIALPRESQWQPDIAHRFIESLVKVAPHIVLQLVASSNRITWEIIDWRVGTSPKIIFQAIHSYYPNADVQSFEYSKEILADPFYRYTILFKHAADFVWPIKQLNELKNFDPLVSITQAISGLQLGEKIICSLAMSIPAHYAYVEGNKLITVDRIKPLQFLSAKGATLALLDMSTGNTREERFQKKDQNIALEKLNSQLYQCFLSVQIESPMKERVLELVNLDTLIWQYENSPYNALVWLPENLHSSIRLIDTPEKDLATSSLGILRSWVMGQDERWQNVKLILSPQEIASLWHLPDNRFKASEIVWAKGRRVPAPPDIIQQNKGVLLGENVFAGRRAEVKIPYPDRDTHMYVVGKTGVGKSNFLHHIIHQDIASGKGVGVIDPHGKLVQDILQCSIPKDREKDVVLIDLAQTEYPPPLNPFSLPASVSKQVAISHILNVLRKIYAEAWSKTRMENALYSALVALMNESPATPRDISRIFLDQQYRHQLLKKITDPVALEYWNDEYEQLSEGMQSQTREPVLHRIRIFYRNRAVRNMVCHPHRLDFSQVINQGKIFLASLRSEETESELANLGALLITNFQMASMSNHSAKENHTTPYYLFIDEVQQFITTSLPTVLSEARKFGLSMTAANQFLGQLKGDTLEAVLGNVGTTVIFSCSPSDANALAPIVKPEFTSEDLVNFDRFHAAISMNLNKQALPAFSLHPFLPIEIPDDANEREARIRQLSIEQYTPWHRDEVENWLQKRYTKDNSRQADGGITDYD